MIREAVTCDTAGCLGRLLEPDDMPEGTPFEDHLAGAGWEFDAVAGHRCPACVAGRTVPELGDCPACGGAEVDLPSGTTCHYCRHVTPHAPDGA